MLTMKTLCERTGALPHRIRYAIKTRGIRPVGRAGLIFVYSEDAVPRIIEALRETAEYRRVQ